MMHRIDRGLAFFLGSLIALLPAASPTRAGQSDINLFAGGGEVAPNIVIMLDSSGSMQSAPSSGGALTKKQIAISALTNLITTVNPLISGTTYEENARFGLFTFRNDGALLNQSISAGNTQAVLNGISSHASSSVGTPVSGSILDVGRYYAAGEAWGTLDAWGTRTSEPAVTNPFDFSCRKSFALVITDGDPNGDAISVGGFWDTIGDSDGDAGVGENGTENLANVGVNNIEWSDDITKAMFDRDFKSSLEGQQNVITHVIGFDTNGNNLQRMATNGGGLYRTSTNAAGLTSALTDLTTASFDTLASYSTAVVPTSRTAFGSAFFNAYFEPTEGAAFWEGHIEAYDISPAGEILDASGNPAIDASTDEFDDPPNPHWDAGVLLRSNSSRSLYTTLSDARANFTNDAAVRAALGINVAEIPLFPNSSGSGVTTQLQAEDAVINYLKGQDAFDEDNDIDATELRPAVLGDVFHSTPIIVGAPSTLLSGESGYDAYRTSYAGRQRILYVGANDGMLHAFDAGSLTTGDNPLTPAVETAAVFYTPGSGSELFGYVPGLLLDDVKLVPRNNPRTYYFVDGSPVVSDVWLRSGAGDYTREAAEWPRSRSRAFGRAAQAIWRST